MDDAEAMLDDICQHTAYVFLKEGTGQDFGYDVETWRAWAE
jgi:hypothetical protein